MGWGKGHLEEVQSKALHEEEECEEGGKDSPNIRKYVKKGEIFSMNDIGSGRALDPEISGSLSGHGDPRPGFKGLSAEATLFKCVGDGSNTAIGV